MRILRAAVVLAVMLVAPVVAGAQASSPRLTFSGGLASLSGSDLPSLGGAHLGIGFEVGRAPNLQAEVAFTELGRWREGWLCVPEGSNPCAPPTNFERLYSAGASLVTRRSSARWSPYLLAGASALYHETRTTPGWIGCPPDVFCISAGTSGPSSRRGHGGGSVHTGAGLSLPIGRVALRGEARVSAMHTARASGVLVPLTLGLTF